MSAITTKLSTFSKPMSIEVALTKRTVDAFNKFHRALMKQNCGIAFAIEECGQNQNEQCVENYRWIPESTSIASSFDGIVENFMLVINGVATTHAVLCDHGLVPTQYMEDHCSDPHTSRPLFRIIKDDGVSELVIDDIDHVTGLYFCDDTNMVAHPSYVVSTEQRIVNSNLSMYNFASQVSDDLLHPVLKWLLCMGVYLSDISVVHSVSEPSQFVSPVISASGCAASVSFKGDLPTEG